MFKRIISAALVFGAAALAPPVAHAGPAEIVPAQAGAALCGPREQIGRHLKERFGEGPAGAGIVNARQIFELWRSLETGTWTILATRADGLSCIVAAGSSWHDLAPKVTADKGT